VDLHSAIFCAIPGPLNLALAFLDESMRCKMCEEDRKLVESHIIPRSFYEPFKGEEGEIPLIVTNVAGVYPKRSPIGVYDRKILCGQCEKIFMPWDTYGHRILFQEFKEENYAEIDGRKIAYNLGSCDYQKLKLFFLSVLWRASVSEQQFFKRVDLGPYEDKLRGQILNGFAGDNSEFAIALSKFSESPANIVKLNPDKTRYDGVVHYRIYMANYMAVVKVSSQRASDEFENLYLAPDRDFYCIIRKFENSKEFKAAVMVAKSAGQRNKF